MSERSRASTTRDKQAALNPPVPAPPASLSESDFRLEFDADGTLHIRGLDGWREPICPVCNEPIRWVLDMASFTTGYEHTYAHARCVWTPEAFTLERSLAHD